MLLEAVLGEQGLRHVGRLDVLLVVLVGVELVLGEFYRVVDLAEDVVDERARVDDVQRVLLGGLRRHGLRRRVLVEGLAGVVRLALADVDGFAVFPLHGRLVRDDDGAAPRVLVVALELHRGDGPARVRRPHDVVDVVLQVLVDEDVRAVDVAEGARPPPALLLEGVQGRGLEVVVAVVGLLVAAVHGLEVRRVDLEAPHDPVEADRDDGELVGREVDVDDDADGRVVDGKDAHRRRAPHVAAVPAQPRVRAARAYFHELPLGVGAVRLAPRDALEARDLRLRQHLLGVHGLAAVRTLLRREAQVEVEARARLLVQ